MRQSTQLTGVTRRLRKQRGGAALLLAIFVLTVVTSLVVATVDSQTLRYAALRNTRDWERARYLAESGLNHALSELEQNIDWRTGISTVEFPIGSGQTYEASVDAGSSGTVVVTATGHSGGFSRVLTATVKQGG